MTDETRCEPPPEWRDETPPEAWGDEYESCPFCGSVEIRPWTDDKTGNHIMWCYTCGADGPPADNDADAEERWNRRVTPPTVVAALVEALEAAQEVLMIMADVTGYGVPATSKKVAEALAAYREAGR